MTPEFFETAAVALGSGVVTGLITFGGISVKLDWIRADLTRLESDAKLAHRRIDAVLHSQPDPEGH